jgi:hypothetical protein
MSGVIPQLPQYDLITWRLIKHTIRLHGMVLVKDTDYFTLHYFTLWIVRSLLQFWWWWWWWRLHVSLFLITTCSLLQTLNEFTSPTRHFPRLPSTFLQHSDEKPKFRTFCSTVHVCETHSGIWQAMKRSNEMAQFTECRMITRTVAKNGENRSWPILNLIYRFHLTKPTAANNWYRVQGSPSSGPF